MPAIDHLIICAPTLLDGMDYVHSIVGIKPVITGQHPQWGTHNAMLSIGSRCFLEVIAPDPDLPIPPTGLLFESYFKQPPHLRSWVVQCHPLDTYVQQFTQSGIEMGSIQKGGRKRPDGRFLEWELSDPYADRKNGLVPFLIDWKDSRHPSLDLPQAGILEYLTIYGPADPLKNIRSLANLPLHFIEAAQSKLKAKIKCLNGRSIEIV